MRTDTVCHAPNPASVIREIEIEGHDEGLENSFTRTDQQAGGNRLHTALDHQVKTIMMGRQ
jgi:hypothetical protein